MTKTLFALTLGCLSLLPHTAAAGPACAVRSAVVAQLAAKYQESRKGIGLAGNDAIVEVFASEAGTWTITVTLPSGMTCLLASGQGWEALAEALPARGDPA